MENIEIFVDRDLARTVCRRCAIPGECVASVERLFHIWKTRIVEQIWRLAGDQQQEKTQQIAQRREETKTVAQRLRAGRNKKKISFEDLFEKLQIEFGPDISEETMKNHFRTRHPKRPNTEWLAAYQKLLDI